LFAESPDIFGAVTLGGQRFCYIASGVKLSSKLIEDFGGGTFAYSLRPACKPFMNPDTVYTASIGLNDINALDNIYRGKYVINVARLQNDHRVVSF
jgi:hypothetical protein